MEDEIKALKDRINNLEIIVASVSSQVQQLKKCEHTWQPVQGPSYIFNRIGAMTYECTKCGMRYNNYDDCECFN